MTWQVAFLVGILQFPTSTESTRRTSPQGHTVDSVVMHRCTTVITTRPGMLFFLYMHMHT